jgi:hypothetical protein
MKIFGKRKEELSPEEKRVRLNTLLFRLSEFLKSPPIVIDLYTWTDDVEGVMDEIQGVSSDAYERLDDLVVELLHRAEQHISDLDADEAPSVVEHDNNLYFEQVARINSEINFLKKL